MVQELPSDLKVLCFFVSDFADTSWLKEQYCCAGVGHYYRRMRGDNELRVAIYQFVHANKQGHLSSRRQRCLRFIENVETATSKSLSHERHERFAMRLGVKRYPAVGINHRRSRSGLFI